MKEYDVLECPFCGKNTISIVRFPSVLQEKRQVTATFGARKERKKSKEIIIFQSGCSNCGKTKEEVEKWYRKES